jgi:putative transposase
LRVSIWCRRWSFSSQQATLRRLDKAFAAFFRRVKAGEKPGYPRFRGVNWFDTVDFPKDGDGCRWDSTPHDPVTRVRLQGVGHVRVHQHRPVKGRVKTVSIKREGNQWYVVLACDNVPAEPLPATGAVTGIDMGVTHFLTTSEGTHVDNPRHGRRNAEALAEAQRALKAFGCRKRENRTAKHPEGMRRVLLLGDPAKGLGALAEPECRRVIAALRHRRSCTPRIAGDVVFLVHR